MNNTELTLNYYNTNSEKFLVDTSGANMNAIRDEFLAYIPAGGKVLDFGCGSGRDSKAFLDEGYEVTAMDGSVEMCNATEKLTGQPVINCTFQEFETSEMFDGIWACSSLLHLTREDICEVVAKLVACLKPGGCLYMSFKYGTFSGERNGRFFTDLDEEGLAEITERIGGLKLDKLALTGDVRPGRSNEKWLNAFYIAE